MRGFTCSPGASGAVSMWAISASTGAFAASFAGSVASTLLAASMRISVRPSSSSSFIKSRPRSFCRSVEGDVPVESSDVV